jgi:hypothetical protein
MVPHTPLDKRTYMPPRAPKSAKNQMIDGDIGKMKDPNPNTKKRPRSLSAFSGSEVRSPLAAALRLKRKLPRRPAHTLSKAIEELYVES